MGATVDTQHVVGSHPACADPKPSGTGAPPTAVVGWSALTSATYFAGHGMPVFPLVAREKKPITENGFKSATCDLAQVGEWWGCTPHLNIGVRTGNGLVVIDVDVDEDEGINGRATLEEWESAHGALPDTFTVTTGRGGQHRYYLVDREVRNSVNKALGVDIRGDGGYAVAPGSVHPNGRRYAMDAMLEDVPVSRADDGVYAFIDYVRPRTAASSRKAAGAVQGRPASAFELPSEIVEGCRHSTILSYAASLRAHGLPESVIADAVNGVNMRRCVPPSPQDEVDKIVSWVCSLEPGLPWYANVAMPEPPAETEDDVVPIEAYALDLPRETASEGHVDVAPEPASPARADDKVMELAKDDVGFLRLFDGDTSGYYGKGKARQALMDRIAFWCQRDKEQMTRIYLKSKLYENEPDKIVRAMVRLSCRKVGTVYDDRLGSMLTYTLDNGLKRPSEPFWTSTGAIQNHRLADVIRKDWHARTIDGSLALWNGERWDFDPKAIDTAIFSYVVDLKLKYRREVAAFITDNRPKLPATESARDYDGQAYVQFDNGTFRVTADAVEPVEPDPSMLVVGHIHVNYGETCPNAADDFLDSISCGDASVRAKLEEVMGACLTAHHAVSKAIVLTGESGAGGSIDASNGKSTFVSVLRTLVGSENVSSINPEALGQRFQASSVIGKLAILADETNRDAFEGGKNAAFKSLVSGNTLHTDVKHRDGTDFLPLATVVVSLNGSLSVSELDGGLGRRLTFVPFRAHFREGEANCRPNIASELAHDGEAMRRFAWLAVLGLQRLLRNHRYTHVGRSEEILERVRVEGDPVAAWAREESVDYLERIDGRQSGEVYAEFKTWAEESGYDNIPTITAFRRRIAEDDQIVRSIEEAMREGKLEPMERWRLVTDPKYDRFTKKTVRRYCVKRAE